MQEVSAAQLELVSGGWSADGPGEGKRLTHTGSLAPLLLSFDESVENRVPDPISVPPLCPVAVAGELARFSSLGAWLAHLPLLLVHDLDARLRHFACVRERRTDEFRGRK